MQSKVTLKTYTAEEVSTLIGCSLQHVYLLCRSGKNVIPGKIKVGRMLRFNKEIVDQWIATGEVPNVKEKLKS